ncbi:MAG: glycosyltransferase family 4 protein [Thermoguttaceae bacterium]|nr:glycosyltransferase family 4 protein [Thermoguttaceae bacterium]MDW8037774.1 glycosyltransferase family 4 protein [Thermoguttaceae bacterium]
MKLLALVENLEDPCCRYRVRPFGPALAELGIRLEIAQLCRSPWGRLRQLRHAGRVDGVLLQRKLLPFWQLMLLRRWARKLIYDLDDALFQRDSYHPKGPHSWQRAFAFCATVRASDAVLAGNRYLAERVARSIGPERVYRVPTCVDCQRYPLAEHRQAGAGVKLVWIGQPSNLPSLFCIQAHLAEAARRVAGLSLRIICNRFPHLEGIRVLPYRWSEELEPVALAEADIGICWLPPDTWSLGKCGLKVLQSMAAGLPVVANPFGIHRELVHHGKTGFLAETPQQWAEAIEQLVWNPALRRAVGHQARTLVEEQYNVARWAPRWAKIVAGILTAKRVLPANDCLGKKEAA